MSDLFQLGDFQLASGEKSYFKIDCDALTPSDVQCVAFLIAQRVPPFQNVIGIPTGGIRLEHALEQYCSAASDDTLLVDDVLTTGGSLEKLRSILSFPTFGAVIFARGPCPAWVTPLFQMI